MHGCSYFVRINHGYHCAVAIVPVLPFRFYPRVQWTKGKQFNIFFSRHRIEAFARAGSFKLRERTKWKGIMLYSSATMNSGILEKFSASRKSSGTEFRKFNSMRNSTVFEIHNKFRRFFSLDSLGESLFVEFFLFNIQFSVRGYVFSRSRANAVSLNRVRAPGTRKESLTKQDGLIFDGEQGLRRGYANLAPCCVTERRVWAISLITNQPDHINPSSGVV